MFKAELPQRDLGSLLKSGDTALLGRYRTNYNLGDDITLDHVQRHVHLEAELTDALITSTPDNRWDVFSSAYSRLYEELPWLASTGGKVRANLWAGLMKPGAKLLEVGSGAGDLLTELASMGFECHATEISRERGEKLTNTDKVIWRTTDGVNLDRFEAAGSFHHVISDQVVEHLHPEDILTHFSAARTLLKPGGSYIVRTPHRSCGPSDLSGVLGMDRAAFMHLHEFLVTEFRAIAKASGYKGIRAVFWVPGTRIARLSHAYLHYLTLLDHAEVVLFGSKAKIKKWFRLLARAGLAPPNIWVELMN